MQVIMGNDGRPTPASIHKHSATGNISPFNMIGMERSYVKVTVQGHMPVEGHELSCVSMSTFIVPLYSLTGTMDLQLLKYTHRLD